MSTIVENAIAFISANCSCFSNSSTRFLSFRVSKSLSFFFLLLGHIDKVITFLAFIIYAKLFHPF